MMLLLWSHSVGELVESVIYQKVFVGKKKKYKLFPSKMCIVIQNRQPEFASPYNFDSYLGHTKQD